MPVTSGRTGRTGRKSIGIKRTLSERLEESQDCEEDWKPRVKPRVIVSAALSEKKLGETENCDEAVMVGDAYWRDAEFVSRYDENSLMKLVETVAKFAVIQPPSLRDVLWRHSVTGFWEDYEDYKSEVAQVSRGGISVVPVGVRGSLSMSQRYCTVGISGCALRRTCDG